MHRTLLRADEPALLIAAPVRRATVVAIASMSNRVVAGRPSAGVFAAVVVVSLFVGVRPSRAAGWAIRAPERGFAIELGAPGPRICIESPIEQRIPADCVGLAPMTWETEPDRWMASVALEGTEGPFVLQMMVTLRDSHRGEWTPLEIRSHRRALAQAGRVVGIAAEVEPLREVRVAGRQAFAWRDQFGPAGAELTRDQHLVVGDGVVATVSFLHPAAEAAVVEPIAARIMASIEIPRAKPVWLRLAEGVARLFVAMPFVLVAAFVAHRRRTGAGA